MIYNKKRTEKIANLEIPSEGIPQAVQEAHLEFVIAMMESVYDSEGLEGLMVNAWTDMLVAYANRQGMQVTKEILRERIEEYTPMKKHDNFFAGLREALMEFRTGITADKQIRATLDTGGYVV